MLLCANGRAVAQLTESSDCRFVDAVTGALLPRDAVWRPMLDTSGALVAQDKIGRLIALGSPNSAGHALPDARDSEVPQSFHYGVCALRRPAGEWRVVRFDAAPDAPRYPTRD